MQSVANVRWACCLLLLTVAGLFVTSAGPSVSGISQPKATVAQRYPLRQRTNNFYNRSKISYARTRG